MRITEFSTASQLAMDDVLLLDGLEGSRKVQVVDLFYQAIESLGVAKNKQAYPRGRNLGSTLSPAHKSEIVAGTFRNLWLGDYWSIGGVNYRIVDFNYWKRYSAEVSPPNENHVVVMPDAPLYSASMNPVNTTSGGYLKSAMYTTGLNSARATFVNAFGDSLIKHQSIFVSATEIDGKPTTFANVSVDVEIPNESMLFGTASLAYKTDNPWNFAAPDKRQFALFKHWGWVGNGSDMWLRDVVNRYVFTCVRNEGYLHPADAGTVLGVRPIATIG